MNIHLVGVPSDLGASRRGCDIGPNAVRYARLDQDPPTNEDPNLGERLRKLGHTIIDEGNLAVSPRETPPFSNPKLKSLEPIVAICDKLVEVTERICRTNGFPLVIGGDHSIALGSIAGVVKARGNIGVLWIDAHGDFNTDKTTPSGNIHGMPLAALAGLGDDRLVDVGGPGRKVDPAHIAIVGARSLDPGEKDLLHEAKVSVFTMEDIDREGIARTIVRALEVTTSGTSGLHVSFDIDVLDPLEAPGVGTPVPGGLTYREGRLAMELIAASGKLTSLDMVEVNPTLDHANRTAKLAVELILAAFGKRLY